MINCTVAGNTRSPAAASTVPVELPFPPQPPRQYDRGCNNTATAGSNAPDIYGTVTARRCLIEDVNGVTFAPALPPHSRADPQLGALGSYGGSTKDDASAVRQPGHRRRQQRLILAGERPTSEESRDRQRHGRHRSLRADDRLLWWRRRGFLRCPFSTIAEERSIVELNPRPVRNQSLCCTRCHPFRLRA